MSIEVTGKGPKIEAVQHHKSPIPDKVKGEHLWIVLSMFRVTPSTDAEYHLDTENLLTIDGPGCFHCEQTWQPGMEGTTCPGEPL
jgi:hypothetical protein